ACGVDALFVEAVTTPDEMDTVCRQFSSRIPLLANMVAGGKTPIQPLSELEARGYRIVIFPGGTARYVSSRLRSYYASLKQHGTTEPMWPEMLSFDELNALIGTPELLETGKRYEA